MAIDHDPSEQHRSLHQGHQPMTLWRFVQIAGLALAILFISIVSGMRAPVLPEIGREFQVTAVQLGYIGSAFGLGRLIADLPAGALAGRMSPTWLMAGSALFMAGGALLMAVTAAFAMVVAGAAMMGAGSGVMTTVSMVVFSRLGTRETRGRYLSIYQAANLGGQSVGPVWGGVMAALTGWRMALASGVAACGAAAVLSVPARTVLLHEGNGKARSGEGAVRWLSVIALFIVPVAIFFSLSGFQQTIIPLFASQELSLGPGQIGLALGIAGSFRFLGSIGTGFVSDRFGRKKILVYGLIAQGIGTVLILFARSFTGLTLGLFLLTILSAGVTVGATMLGDIAGHKAGTLIGAYRFIGDFGMLIGPWLLGLTYQTSGITGAVLINAGVLVLTGIAVWHWTPETRWESSE